MRPGFYRGKPPEPSKEDMEAFRTEEPGTTLTHDMFYEDLPIEKISTAGFRIFVSSVGWDANGSPTVTWP